MAAKTGKFTSTGQLQVSVIAVPVIVALLFRLVFLLSNAYPFNADEAIVALMARHILVGQWPIFFYGQAYMGSLDATLIASGFGVFGQNIWVLRAIQLFLYSAVVITSIQLSWKLTANHIASLVTGLLLAVPTVNLNLYTTVTLGGYGEALLLGNVLLLLTLRLIRHPPVTWLLVLWGLVAGVAFWAFGLTLIYSVPAFLLLTFHFFQHETAKHTVRRYFWILLGSLIGAAPILFWVFQNGADALVTELFGAAIADRSNASYLSTLGSHSLNFLLFGIPAIFGLRPPWDVQIYIWPLAIVVALFWIAVGVQFVRSLKGSGSQLDLARLLGGVMISLVLGFILTPFGGDPSGRYFIPITVAAAILAGGLFTGEARWFPGWMKWSLLASVLVFQLGTNLLVLLRSDTGFTTQFDPIARIDHEYDDELIRFLEQKGETRGYSNYWVAYPLAFRSEEQLIFVPRLPYHQDFRYTPRDNRYAPYNEIVEASDRVAYITTNHPELDERIRSRFQELGVQWEEHVIGDYQVFYGLSKIVFPEEIDERFQQ